MLSKMGKLSGAVTIVGAAMLLSAPEASAMMLEQCTAEEEQAACEAGGTAWYMDMNEYWCGVAYGCHVYYDSANNRVISFGISYYNNGSQPCPVTQPCV
jgi:hypothetical protein